MTQRSGLLLLLLLAITGCDGDPTTQATETPPAGETTAPAASARTDATAAGPQDFAAVAERVKRAVINVNIEAGTGGPRRRAGDFFGDDPFALDPFGALPRAPSPPRRGIGSGVIIDPAGIALTNAHVVQGASAIEAVTLDGKKQRARLLGFDVATDLAVIDLEGDGFHAAAVGDSDDARVGEWVIAIGSPFGLQATVTAGILSARARQIGAGPFDDFLQTDAAINPGNSGGPLINMAGQVIGINTAIVAGASGVGFAIPSNIAMTVSRQLREHGRVTRGFLGVSVQPVTEELARTFGVAAGQGALVADVQPDSPAAAAGLRPGDVIVEAGGKPITDPADLQRVIGLSAPGKEVRVRYLRDGAERVATARLGEQAEQSPTRSAAAPPTPGSRTGLGLQLEPLTPELARELKAAPGAGVVVTGVDPQGAAAAAGVRRGDVIREVDRQPVADPQAVARALRKAKDTVTLRIERQGTGRYVTVPLGRG